MVTDLTTSKGGSITGVEVDPRFAFIAKALYGIRYSRKRGSAAVRQCNPPPGGGGGQPAKRYAVGGDDVIWSPWDAVVSLKQKG